jgi:prephenate dehydratase
LQAINTSPADGVEKHSSFLQHSEFVAASVHASAAGSVDNERVEIYFSLTDKPGALIAALQLFTKYGMNLTHIDSKPSKTK